MKMSVTTDKVISSYARLKNLKLVEMETGIKWQKVYTILRRRGVPVCGDKARYGSATDRVALIGESKFAAAVPFAENNNQGKWQATVDFSIKNILVDVKTSYLMPGGRLASGKSFTPRWCFCINKQKDIADFFVLYALGDKNKTKHIFLMPNEIATSRSTISIPLSLKSKWADYRIEERELSDFFRDMTT